MKTLAVDPGLLCTGWSIFDEGIPVICDKITMKSKDTQSSRLAKLVWEFQTIIEEHEPEIMIIEDQFVGKNMRTSLVTARAKGVIIAAAAMSGIQVIEYAPSEIKSVVTGKGNATKEFVAEELIKIYSDNEIVKSLGPYSDKTKSKNDDMYDSLGINHTYWVLKTGRII